MVVNFSGRGHPGVVHKAIMVISNSTVVHAGYF
ncbi:MAG: hypothetical protein JWQ78_798 [Sediminibacterium sp.]|nr:hypothetical protein [Sediminibacterium sp.]